MKDQYSFEQVITVRLAEVESELYKKFYQLNLRSHGEMRGCLVANKKAPDSFVCYTLDDKNKVTAWAMIYNYYGQASVHFYVRKTHRRKGLGTRLTEAAIRVAENFYAGKLHYFPHDRVSRSFFESCRNWGIINKTNDFNQGYYSPSVRSHHGY